MTLFSDNQTNVQPLFRTARRPHAGSSVSAIFLAVAEILYRWQSRSAQRRILSGMSDYHLKDIGLSRADVEGESGKSFWQE